MTTKVPVDVKICGIRDAKHAHVAAEAGAHYLGFVFFTKSPRNLTLAESIKLEPLLPKGPGAPKRVGVFVNADVPFIMDRAKALSLDMIQLHGTETPSDVAIIKASVKRPVIKAIAVSTEQDITRAEPYLPHVDQILFDAKPPAGAILPGGNAVSFPWHIMQGKALPYSWILAGGLTSETIATAVAESGAKTLDVSSGVEVEPGKKSSEQIKAFLTAAKAVK